MFRRGFFDRFRVELLILRPVAAFLEVRKRELVVLLFVKEPVREPLLLLILRHVKEDLHHAEGVLPEILFPVPDLIEAFVPEVLVVFDFVGQLAVFDVVVEPYSDDVLIVRPVEDPDHAAGRERTVHTPEVIVILLDHGRSLEGRDPHASGVDFRKDVTHGAVFPRRVHSLQDEDD